MRRMLAESFRPVLRRSGAALLAAAACLVSRAPAAAGARARPRPGTPVILISIDTLRADHLPAYGYRGVDTPNLDALRRDAILFENAYSQVPLTLPSHTAIMTGLLPPQNGVRDNLGYALGPGPATLAATLKAQGLRDRRGRLDDRALARDGDRARIRLLRGQHRAVEGQPVHLARAAQRQRYAGAAGRVGRRAFGQAVLRVPAPLRAALALRAARAVPLPVQAALRRRDRAGRRDRRQLREVPQAERRLRPRPHRVPLGPRRGPRRPRRGRARRAHLPRVDPRAADGQASEVGARGRVRARRGRAGRRLSDRRGGRSGIPAPAGPGRPLAARRARSGRRGAAADLQRDALPAAAPRVERPCLARRRARPLHRVSAARALRPRRRTRARRTTSRRACRRPSARCGRSWRACRGRCSRRAAPTPSR